jgi:hypothetical protein
MDLSISHVELDSFLAPESTSVTTDPLTAVLLAKLDAVDQRLNALSFNGAASARPSRPFDRVPNLTPEKIAAFKKAGKCFRCGEAGHMKNECPKRK